MFMPAPRGHVIGALFTQGAIPPMPPHNQRMTVAMGRAWAQSIVKHGYQPILFSDVDCSSLPVKEVRLPCRGFPHTYRFVVIAEYLKQHDLRGEVWCTDVRDVIMNAPPEPKPGFLYVGSEQTDFDSWRWLAERAQGCPFWEHVKKPPVNYNCGIVGGIDIVDFMQRLGDLNKACSGLNDMHSFIYALQGRTSIVTGSPVHNRFGFYTAGTEWFLHK